MFTGTCDKFIDEYLFTVTKLMQFKAAVLVVELIILHILPVNNMKTSILLTAAH